MLVLIGYLRLQHCSRFSGVVHSRYSDHCCYTQGPMANIVDIATKFLLVPVLAFAQTIPHDRQFLISSSGWSSHQKKSQTLDAWKASVWGNCMRRMWPLISFTRFSVRVTFKHGTIPTKSIHNPFKRILSL